EPRASGLRQAPGRRACAEKGEPDPCPTPGGLPLPFRRVVAFVRVPRVLRTNKLLRLTRSHGNPNLQTSWFLAWPLAVSQAVPSARSLREATSKGLQKGSLWLCVPLSCHGREQSLHRNCHHHRL
ncbi:unnamed protein product, partial [Ixodes pacificus]